MPAPASAHKRRPKPPTLAPTAANGSTAVARDSVINKLRAGDVFVLLDEPSIAEDTFHLVPSNKDTKKKELKSERVSLTTIRTAVRFDDPVYSDTFKYDFVHARAGDVRDLVLGEIPGRRQPEYAPSWTEPDPPHAPAQRPAAPPDVDPHDDDLREARADVLALAAEEPKV